MKNEYLITIVSLFGVLLWFSLTLNTVLLEQISQKYHDGNLHGKLFDALTADPWVMLAVGTILGLFLGALFYRLELWIKPKLSQYDFMKKKKGHFLTRKRKSPGYTKKIISTDVGLDTK